MKNVIYLEILQYWESQNYNQIPVYPWCSFSKGPLKGQYKMLFLLYNLGQESSHCRKKLFNIDENKKDEFSGKLSSP